MKAAKKGLKTAIWPKGSMLFQYLSYVRKSKQKELDVDFIGGQGSLTKEEEQKISECLRTQKLLKEKKQSHAKKILPRRKVIA